MADGVDTTKVTQRAQVRPGELDTPAIRQMRVDLGACFSHRGAAGHARGRLLLQRRRVRI